jgi:hypothetical protein
MKVKETEMVVAADQLPIPELYQQCLHNENEWTKLDLEELKISLLKSHRFGQRLFSPAPPSRRPAAVLPGRRKGRERRGE